MIKAIHNQIIKKINYACLNNKDLIIASYPRSGSTWLRFIIAHTIKHYHDLDQEINFSTIHNFVPDQHITSILGKRYAPFPRMIKTHDKCQSKFDKVIYLLRDPIDVLHSYFGFLVKTNRTRIKSIEQFVKDSNLGLRSWLTHVKSYLHQADQVLIYQNVVTDAEIELKKLNQVWKKHWNFSVESRLLRQAAANSSKDKMYQTLNNKENISIVSTRRNTDPPSDEVKSYVFEQLRDWFETDRLEEIAELLRK